MQKKKEIVVTPTQYVEIIKRRRRAINEHLKVLDKLDQFTKGDCTDIMVLATVVQRMCVMMPEESHEYVPCVRGFLAAAGVDVTKYDKMIEHDNKASEDDTIEKSVCGHGTPMYAVAFRCVEDAELYEKEKPWIEEIYDVFDRQRKTLRGKLELAKSRYLSLSRSIGKAELDQLKEKLN